MNKTFELVTDFVFAGARVLTFDRLIQLDDEYEAKASNFLFAADLRGQGL